MRSLTLFMALVGSLTVSVLSADFAQAQYQQDYRDRPNRWEQRQFDDGQRGRDEPGVFDYYTLVLSWSPTYCATADSGRDDMQCNRRDGRRYAFVLHGLWPQYERGYPQSCRTRRKPFVPQPVIDGMLDIMPSPGLVIHEYRKHGTCSGLDPAGYFDLSRRLYGNVRIPERYINPFETQSVSPEQLAADFVAANPQLRRNMIAVSCGGGGNRLKEVRICMSKEGQPRPCGSNEDQRRLCSAANMFVPPVRSRRDAIPAAPGRPSLPAQRPQQNQPPDNLPGPRLIEGGRGI